VYSKLSEIQNHRREHKPKGDFEVASQAHGGSAIDYVKKYPVEACDVFKIFQHDNQAIKDIIAFECEKKHVIKFNVIAHLEFVKFDGPELYDMIAVPMKTMPVLLNRYDDFDEVLEAMAQDINERKEMFVSNGSNWVLNSFLKMVVQIAACQALRGGCGTVLVKSDKDDLKIVGLNRGDRDCFYYAVASHFVASTDIKVLRAWIASKLIKVQTPVAVHSIQKFEELNHRLSIRLNVMYKEPTGKIYPAYVSKNLKAVHTICLMLYRERLDEDSKIFFNHYARVSDIDKLLRNQYKKKNRNVEHATKKSYQKAFTCLNCLNKYSSQRIRDEHLTICGEKDPQKVILPHWKDDTTKFQNYIRKFKVPIFGVFDFECVMSDAEYVCNTCQTTNVSNCRHKSTIENIQTAIAFSFMLMSSAGKMLHFHTYSGEKAGDAFIEHLLDIEESVQELLKTEIPLVMTPEDEAQWQLEETCHICEERFKDENIDVNTPEGRAKADIDINTPEGRARAEKIMDESRVRDHCHLTGDYMGAAHNKCNLLRRKTKKVPLFCHNFSSYDSHLLVRALDNPRVHKVRGLPSNSEKFRTLELNIWSCIDSMSFLPGSLASSVDDLVKSGHNFPLIQESKLAKNDDEKNLLLRKGIAH
jgi:hypothetical protein